MLDNEEKYVGKDASSWSIDSKSPTHHSEIYIRIIIHIYPIPSIKNIDKNLPEILDPARESRLGWPKRPTSQSSGQKDRQKAFVGPTSVLFLQFGIVSIILIWRNNMFIIVYMYMYYVPCKLVGPLQGNWFSNHVFLVSAIFRNCCVTPPNFQPMLNEGFRKCGYPQIIRKLDHHYPWLSIKTHGFGYIFRHNDTKRTWDVPRCSIILPD
jgi:hypothetical protein